MQANDGQANGVQNSHFEHLELATGVDDRERLDYLETGTSRHRDLQLDLAVSVGGDLEVGAHGSVHAPWSPASEPSLLRQRRHENRVMDPPLPCLTPGAHSTRGPGMNRTTRCALRCALRGGVRR